MEKEIKISIGTKELESLVEKVADNLARQLEIEVLLCINHFDIKKSEVQRRVKMEIIDKGRVFYVDGKLALSIGKPVYNTENFTATMPIIKHYLDEKEG